MPGTRIYEQEITDARQALTQAGRYLLFWMPG